jgi:predicted dehydrogenase
MEARRVRRLGLIGVGKHGARYARHIRDEAPDLELAAIARRAPDKLAATARELGAEPYADYRELIERAEVDALIVVVPPMLHVDIVARAARAGIPVLLEKPAAPNLGAGREMLAALRAHPTPVMVAQTLRYNTVVRVLAAACERIGALRSLTFTQRFEPSSLGWLDDPSRSGGGIVLHTGVHAFDLMWMFSGLTPESVTCQTQALHTRRTEDSFVATVRLGAGAALATVSCARTAGARNAHIELVGERGTLIGDHVLNHAQRVVGTAVEPLPVGASVPTVREVLRDFVGALRAGSPMPVTLADGLRAVAVADACYAAARSGQRTAVTTLEDGPRRCGALQSGRG